MVKINTFAFCTPPKNGKIWCKHHNGSWAPPFIIGDTKKLPLEPNPVVVPITV